MRKVLLGVLLAGVLVWSCPAVVVAGDCDPAAQGLCSAGGVPICDIPAECPSGPSANCGCDWFDDFETYDLGYMPRVNGWEEWAPVGADPDLRGQVVDSVSSTDGTCYSGIRCLEITGHITSALGTDQVRRMYGITYDGGWIGGYEHPNDATWGHGGVNDGVGYDIDVSDYWVNEAWVMIPPTHGGESLFIMMSEYTDTGGSAWSVQLQMNGNGIYKDRITSVPAVGLGENLALVKDRWVLIEVDIDLENDQNVIWYDGQFLAANKWAANPSNPSEVWGDLLNIAAYDLFNAAGDTFYYDDLATYAAEPPPCLPPLLQCFPKDTFLVDDDGNETRCADYLWEITNQNRDDAYLIETFYLDIEAGKGGMTTTNECRGASSSTTAITPPANWSVVKCTNWNNGHALFKFTANAPEYYLSVGQKLNGGLTVDPNLSAEVLGSGTGTTIAGLSVVISAAQSCANEPWETCAGSDYSFGPSGFAAGVWAGARTCYGYIDVPATSAWAKVLLAIVLVGGGALLVLRSRRPVTA